MLSANGLKYNRKEMWEYEVLSLHSISTCYSISKGWATTENRIKQAVEVLKPYIWQTQFWCFNSWSYITFVFSWWAKHTQKISLAGQNPTALYMYLEPQCPVQFNWIQTVIRMWSKQLVQGSPWQNFYKKKIHLSFCKYCSTYFTVKKHCTLLS